MRGYILIVENERDIADVMRRYLEFEGFTIVCASSVEEARIICARKRPDLILLDWHLPEIEGDEWAEELRAHSSTADIPIVMISGYIRAEDRRMAEQLQIDQLIYKSNTIDCKNRARLIPLARPV